MPGGNRTEFPVFPHSEMPFLAQKYEEWAPEPFNKLPAPQGIFGPASPVSPAPMIRWMHILGGLDDIVAMAFSGQMFSTNVERSFKVVKTKVWLGIVPVTDARWRAKGLDATDNIEEALAIINQVVDVFKHLAKPEVQGDLRNINIKLWAEIDVFQDACNAVRTTKGEPAPEWSLTKLWETFNEHHFKYMEEQARSWAFTHLKTLHNIWKKKFLTTFQSGRILNDTQATVRIDHYDMMIMRKIQELQFEADLYIRSRTDGFITASREINPALSKIDSPKEQLNEIYRNIEISRISAMEAAFMTTSQARTQHRHRVAPVPAFLEEPSLNTDREFAHKALQPEIENPPAMRMERWVREQMDEKVERFGFVIYRLAYEGSDGAWKQFLRKVETGIESGLEGLIGVNGIKSKMTLHWIDGREGKIPEGDINAARKDFKSISSLPSFPTGLAQSKFLAITPDSLFSFSDAREGDRKGDYRGFLQAVDADFDPSKEEQNRKANPKGYDGSFKIIDQLVWTDLFAVSVACHAQTMQDYWALAAQHPWGVYVGPTTGVRRRQWREMNGGLGFMLEASKKIADERAGRN
ncbi:hypothetical protein ONS95_010710 [Cadophora gregata]|nr:uncharacterized protein ONS95_010710 [Cadophora gregata]KAK0122479.1 hypothetical protein ONS95_010710 [Cadophora gregata]KAK0127956.1 hypothetical protein ONS96_007453 [Cadophora gregata f. sp. sojae]